MTPGHKIPECDGKWIDVSTLTQRKVMCVKCRATLPISLDAVEGLPSILTPEETQASEPSTESGPVANEGYAPADSDIWFPLAAIFLVSCGLSGVVGFLLGRMSQ